MSPINVFISWSGELGSAVALALAETVLEHPTITTYVSPRMRAGVNFHVEVEAQLRTASFGLVCVTPSALSSRWVHYEAGSLSARLGQLPLLLFGVPPEKIPEPLGAFQAIRNPTDDVALTRLLIDIAGRERTAKELQLHVQNTIGAFRERLTAAGLTIGATQIVPDGTLALEAAGSATADAASELAGRPGVVRNGTLQRVILHGLAQTARVARAMAVETDPTALRYVAPAGEYPEFLIKLQESANARVNAIALVNQEEYFWQGREGRAILDSSHAGSRRVFVFKRPDDFVGHLNTLLAHSDVYKVYAMDARRLAASFERYAYDFSIIETVSGNTVSKVLAMYESRDHVERDIVFSVNPRLLQLHEDTLARVIRYAVPIERETMGLDELIDNVFRTELTPLAKRPVEMSAYISIDDYDAHELRHAYYSDMMSLMIDMARAHPQANGRAFRLLELGAGTGIFTRRLGAAFPTATITAVEIDWPCYKRLASNTRDLTNVSIVNDDSRDYDGAVGDPNVAQTQRAQYDIIFTSFADHHIHPADKPAYLRNVRHNLAPGGLFIVGDEFLPPYSDGDTASYHDALHRYHGHIIALAEEANEPVLAGLERAALQSGLNGLGDFKISCSVFNHILTDAGFDFQATLIGPTPEAKAATLGGVYVYRATPTPPRPGSP